MGSKYMILAAKYPYKGYSESDVSCKTLIGMFAAVIKLQLHGFDIIDISCRTMKKLGDKYE